MNTIIKKQRTIEKIQKYNLSDFQIQKLKEAEIINGCG